MSAFICDTKLFEQILDRLARDHTKTHGYTLVGVISHYSKVHRPNSFDLDPYEMAELMVNDWQKANIMAVEHRYHHHNEPPVEAEPIKLCHYRKPVSLVVLCKHLMCLDYQCSEDVPAEHKEWHDDVVAEIKCAIKEVALAIVAEQPEYDSAPWGDAA